jgi:hypothetical protein
MQSARLIRSRRALVPIVAGVLVWTSIASVAVAADKTFSASVAPSPLVAGATYGAGARVASPLVVTINNTSTANTSLGSANITPPPGIVVTGTTTTNANVVGGIVQVRNMALAPGSSLTVNLAAQVECGANHAAYTWGFAVKQANDFNGVGNDFTQAAPVTSTVAGNCFIDFSSEPAHSEKAPIAITDTIYDPSGGPVTVTVYDALAVDSVGWWSGTIALTLGDDPTAGLAVLGGTISGSASGGSVEFAPTIDLSGTGYSLIATATPTAGSASVGTSTSGVESANFNIVDDATICAHGNSCFAQASVANKLTAKVDAAATGGEQGDLIIIAINDPTVSFDCAGYTETSDYITYDVTASDGTTPSDRAKQATFTLAAAFVTKSASKYELCYSSDQPFRTKSGATATTGLLPACANRNPVAPCIAAKFLDRQKNLVIVVSSPPGDPKGRF